MSDTIKKQIIFANGHAYDLLAVNDDGISRQLQGHIRSCIDAQFPVDQFDAIRAEIAIAGNLDSLTITRDVTPEGGETMHSEWAHTNYNIVQHVGINTVELAPATDTTQPVTESRVSLMLAQLTFLEVQQAAQQSQIDALVLATLEV
nr:MAG TPA: hypothetical protein [Caudoviricetes sp.]